MLSNISNDQNRIEEFFLKCWMLCKELCYWPGVMSLSTQNQTQFFFLSRIFEGFKDLYIKKRRKDKIDF